MTPDQTQQLKRLLIATSAYYGRQLDDHVLKLYTSALSQFTFEEVNRAVEHHILHSKNRFMPLISDIIEIIRPSITDKDKAIVLARAIEKAVKHHQNWPEGVFIGGDRMYEGGDKLYHEWSEAVIAEVGLEGYEVIRRIGWQTLLTNWVKDDPSTFHAQLRDTCAALLKYEIVKAQDPQLGTGQKMLEGEP